jgi:hypothetical protein
MLKATEAQKFIKATETQNTKNSSISISSISSPQEMRVSQCRGRPRQIRRIQIRRLLVTSFFAYLFDEFLCQKVWILPKSVSVGVGPGGLVQPSKI